MKCILHCIHCITFNKTDISTNRTSHNGRLCSSILQFPRYTCKPWKVPQSDANFVRRGLSCQDRNNLSAFTSHYFWIVSLSQKWNISKVFICPFSTWSNVAAVAWDIISGCSASKEESKCRTAAMGSQLKIHSGGLDSNISNKEGNLGAFKQTWNGYLRALMRSARLRCAERCTDTCISTCYTVGALHISVAVWCGAVLPLGSFRATTSSLWAALGLCVKNKKTAVLGGQKTVSRLKFDLIRRAHQNSPPPFLQL